MPLMLNKTDQVAASLSSDIEHGVLPPDCRLPSVRRLAERFSVSTMVINSALNHLEQRRLVERFPRRGVTVRPREKRALRILEVCYWRNCINAQQYVQPAFERACRECGVEVVRIDAAFLRTMAPEHAIAQLRNLHCGGAVLNGSFYTGEELELRAVRALGVPVLISRGIAEDRDTGARVLYTDNRAVWRAALEALKSLGYRRVMAIGRIQNFRERTAGEHLALLAELGMEPVEPVCTSWVMRGCEMTYEQLEAALAPRLRETRPEAVLCYSDYVAALVYQYCMAHGVRIPDDLAVMGICGYPDGAKLVPALSTVDMLYEKIGSRAAAILCAGERSFRNGPPVECQRFEVKIRESTPYLKKQEGVKK